MLAKTVFVALEGRQEQLFGWGYLHNSPSTNPHYKFVHILLLGSLNFAHYFGTYIVDETYSWSFFNGAIVLHNISSHLAKLDLL